MGFLIHLFIWRAVWRLGLALWRIPTFGPIIIGLLVLGAIATLVFRAAHGGRWPWQRQDGRDHHGTGNGSRDW